MIFVNCSETMDGFTFPKPVQVIYALVDDPTIYYGGIIFGSRVISGETGEFIDFDSCSYVKIFDEWQDISDIIFEGNILNND